MTCLKHVQEKNSTKPQVSTTHEIDTCECKDAALVSTCCCAKPYGNIHEFDGEHFGNCGDCKEHTDFEKEACCE